MCSSDLIQNGGTAAILDSLKSLISLAQLDRFLPNFAGRRIVATDMFPMSFNLITRQNGGTAAILDLLKSLTSLARLDRFLPNLAGRRNEATDKFRMSSNL